MIGPDDKHDRFWLRAKAEPPYHAVRVPHAGTTASAGGARGDTAKRRHSEHTPSQFLLYWMVMVGAILREKGLVGARLKRRGAVWSGLELCGAGPVSPVWRDGVC